MTFEAKDNRTVQDTKTAMKSLLYKSKDCLYENKNLLVSLACSLLYSAVLLFSVIAQPVMETGGQKMPDEWIDKDTDIK